MRARWVGMAAIVALAVVAATGCSSDDEKESAASTTVAEATSTTELTIENARAREVVTDGTSFSPKRLTVSVGERVTFTNTGGSHSVTPDEPDGWADAGAPLEVWGQAGRAYTTTFDEAGEYAYHCQVHGSAGGKGMSGVIVVK